jgi:threonylcarbamoyladenosine tRNA methylthiotransferase MtaB
VAGYFVENFGCRATQADGAALERQFEERGIVRASTPAQASVVVMNTCTVTAGADQDARAAIRRVRRQNPNARIVVTGCYAQRAPEEIAALPGVSLVIGNSHKHQLAEIVSATAADLAGEPDASVLQQRDASVSEQRDASVPAQRNASVFEQRDAPVAERRDTSVLAQRDPLDFGWRSASSAAIEPASHPRALAPEGLAFVPLTTLTASPGSPIFVSDIFAHTELLAAPVFDAANERTRPNLKVQDGCDNRCSFCVIPYVRGQSRSLEIDRILREVNGLVESGYREVVISGINLGRWGRDLAVSSQPSALSKASLRPTPNDQGLTTLIHAILSETALEKLRISSVEPMDWSDELISLVASSPRVAKHAHVPMQSGSDAVLRRMHRKYRPWHYREKIEKIRAAMPTAAIGADVMVGFPGETGAEFEATRRMIEDLPFTYLHVFTYSARPGTPAAAMPNQVPVHLARERNRILRELAAEKKLEFMRGFVGKPVEAITLSVVGSDADGDFTEALTDNYLKLRLRGRHKANRWMRAQIDDVVNGALVGREVVLTSGIQCHREEGVA